MHLQALETVYAVIAAELTFSTGSKGKNCNIEKREVLFCVQSYKEKYSIVQYLWINQLCKIINKNRWHKISTYCTFLLSFFFFGWQNRLHTWILLLSCKFVQSILWYNWLHFCWKGYDELVESRNSYGKSTRDASELHDIIPEEHKISGSDKTEDPWNYCL